MQEENLSSLIIVKFYSTLRHITKCDSMELRITGEISLFDLFNTLNDKIFKPKEYTILGKSNKDLVPGLLCLVDGMDYKLWEETEKKIQEIKEITLISSLHGG